MRERFFTSLIFTVCLFASALSSRTAPHPNRVNVNASVHFYDLSDPKTMIHYYYYKMYIEKSAHGLKATRDSWTEYLGSGEGHGFTADVFMYKRNIVTVIIDGVAINNADPFREFYHRNEFITSFPLGGLALVIGGGTGFYAGKLPGLFIGGGLGLGTGVFGSSILHGANYERMDSYDVAFQWIIALEYVHRSGAKSEVNKVKDEFRLLKRFRTDYPKKYRFKPDIKIE